jgi:hypothetical protein
MPHNSCDLLMFDVMTVLSSSSCMIFLVGYKVGLEPNDFTHLISNCSAQQCQLGNWILCIAFVHSSHPATMYWFVFARSNPSWWFARLHCAGHVFDVCPSLTSKPHKKHTF